MDKKSISRLSEVEKRTGLLFSKYRSTELVETTKEYIVFPLVLTSTLLRSVCFIWIMIGIAATGLYFVTSGIWGVIVFAIVASVLLVGPLIFFDFLRCLISKMEADLLKIGKLGIDTVRLVATDLRKTAGQSTSVKLPSGSDLFEGVMLGSVIPTVEEVMSTSIPFLGKRISSLVSGILARVAVGIAEAISSVQDAATSAVGEKLGSVLDREAIQNNQVAVSSDLQDQLARWSTKLEAGLGTATNKLERIVHASVGRSRVLTTWIEGVLVICLGNIWAILWFIS